MAGMYHAGTQSRRKRLDAATAGQLRKQLQMMARKAQPLMANNNHLPAPCSSTGDGIQVDLPRREMLRLNVGGGSYRLRTSTLCYRSESSLLGQFARLTHDERLAKCDDYLHESSEYYFERPARLFDAVFDFYTSGYVHKPTDVCIERLVQELHYWRVPTAFFADCCAAELAVAFAFEEGAADEAAMDGAAVSRLVEAADDPFAAASCCVAARRRLWEGLEEPESALWAKAFGLLSVAFVLCSVGGLIVGTMPAMQRAAAGNETAPVRELQLVEYACVAWFTLEFALRLLVAPLKGAFLAAPLNLVDLLTVAPFYVEALFDALDVRPVESGVSNLRWSMTVLRFLRVLRVARIFRLARYSSGLKSFGATIRSSAQEFSMLALFLVTGVIFFSTVMFFLEKDVPATRFHSIPDACWWCIVTMTTVGYGDIVPSTFGGKLIASLASISGVLVLAFPITMIVDNFTHQYENERVSAAGYRRLNRKRRFGKFVA